MVAKKYQNPKGGLNAAGRKFFKRTEGSNLKRPLKTGTSPRRVSFAARNVEIVTSLNEKVNAIMAPAIMPGKINGKVTVQKVTHGVAPRL